MANPVPEESVGTRVAFWRKRRGLTQAGLGERAFLSRSLIGQVENGLKPATPAFVAAVSKALNVDPTFLYGQPFHTGGKGKDDTICIPALRRALSYADLAPELDVPPRTLDVLAAELERLKVLQTEAKLGQIGLHLPAVIEELAIHTAENGQPRAWRLLNFAQAIAISVARRLGYADLAHTALEKAAQSARSSGDEILIHMTVLPRALLLIAVGEWKTALTMLQRSMARINRDHPDGQTVYGAMLLRAAIVSARAGDASSAWEYHGTAAQVAEELKARRVRDRHFLQVTPANAGIHGAAVATELGDYDEAIRLDQDLVLSSRVIPEREAHHQIDMARAEIMLGQHEASLSRILLAEQIAPSMTRYHPAARETVLHLDRYHRRLPEPLRHLESRMGISS